MRTRQDKITLKPKVAKELWALAKEESLDTEGILARLDHFRTYYIHLWERLLLCGDVSNTEFCLTMVKAITKMFEDIRNQRGRADMILEQTVIKYPLMLNALSDDTVVA